MKRSGKKSSSGSRRSVENASSLLIDAVGLHQAGRLDQAEAIYRRILRARPEDADALHYLGLIAYQRGQYREAVSLIHQAIAKRDGAAAFYCNLGNAYKGLAQHEPALQAYATALQLDPGLAAAHFNQGNVLRAVCRTEAAAESYRRALALAPGFAEAWFSLGQACMDLEAIDQADDCYVKAIALNPGYQQALVARAQVLLRLGMAEQSADHYRRAIRLDPAAQAARQGLLFVLNCLNLEPEETFRAHCAWGGEFADPLTRPAASAVRPRHDRIRVGYVSPDFRRHAMRFFIEPVLEHHDRGRFHVFCYYNSAVEDEATRQIKALAETWVDCQPMSDAELAARVADDEIDILVDLAGHSGGNRLLAFARKPAPVQATMLGYLNTTGMAAMDYRISDGVACPPEFERLHTERILRLPHSQWCYRPPADSPECGPLPALSRGRVTFASFHNLAKVNQGVIDLWSRVLHAVEGSRIMLVVWGGKAADHVLESFRRCGIEADRIRLRDPLPHVRYLGLYREADLCLDAFPYTGGTTTCESLWMGVPVVTLKAFAVPGHGGASILGSVGLTEWVAASPEEYVEIARRQASDLDRLARLRGGLRQTMAASPLLDGAAYTRALEEIYRGIARPGP